MSLSKNVKSAVLKALIHGAPSVMNRKAVRILATDPEKAVFGLEDAAEAEGDVAMDEGAVEGVQKKIQEISFDIFPNVKLATELAACKEMDRATFDEFSDVWDQLGKITSKIDSDYGHLVDRFLMDEIASIDGVDTNVVDKVLAAPVDLTTVNSENPNFNFK
jgi:hypothetical protein